jgi:hypothetical protein
MSYKVTDNKYIEQIIFPWRPRLTERRHLDLVELVIVVLLWWHLLFT